jgi:signal peptidase I
MKNTFLEGDRLFVNKFIYGVRIPVIGKIIIPVSKPRRGDKVVFWPPIDSKFPFIKRCMGMPGDKLQVINKQLYVNEELQDEPYVIHSDPVIYSSANSLALNQVIRDNFGPITVSSGWYFMMGDNRDESYDSRYWGIVQEKNIRGKAMFTYWPPVRIGIPK